MSLSVASYREDLFQCYVTETASGWRSAAGPAGLASNATWLPLLLLGNRPAALRAGSKPAVLSWLPSWAPLSICILGDAVVYHLPWEGDPLPPLARAGSDAPPGILQSTTAPGGFLDKQEYCTDI